MYAAIGKRIFDVFLSCLALLVLSPLLIVIAICIKAVDPGPIIFCQTRIGRYARPFSFYKFRSMPINTGDIPSDQIGNLNLTWVGRFIRRTNFDELPQLFNILKGDMSLVGPRPPLASQEELINYRREGGAMNCRPGLTGLAQVNSFNGMTIQQKADYDIQYADNITFIFDVKIISKTFLYLCKPPPVY